MKVYILKKSINDLKNPIIKKEFETNSKTVQDLIIEMVSKNRGELLNSIKLGNGFDEVAKRSAPALQNAETEVNNACHIPIAPFFTKR